MLLTIIIVLSRFLFTVTSRTLQSCRQLSSHCKWLLSTAFSIIGLNKFFIISYQVKTHRRELCSKRPFSHSCETVVLSVRSPGTAGEGCVEPQPATKATGWPRTLSHSSKEVKWLFDAKIVAFWLMISLTVKRDSGISHPWWKTYENYSMTSVPIPEPHTHKEIAKIFCLYPQLQESTVPQLRTILRWQTWNLTLIGVQFALVLDTYTSCLSPEERHTHPLDPELLLRCCSFPPI